MGFNIKKADTASKAPAKRKGLSGIYLEILKALTIALIISLVLILAMSLIITFVDVSDLAISIVNQVIKGVSLLVASLIAFRDKSSGWKKGLILGLIYIVAAYLIFSLMDGKFSISWVNLLDLAAGAVMGVICGIISVNIRKK